MITRFAPSPTGPLHLGHAYSALLAYDMARQAGGTFLLRIEDIDQSRARAEWETQIYEDLHWLGIAWKEPVMRQSDRMEHYYNVINQLWREGLLYQCHCKRRDIQAALSAPQEEVSHGPDGMIYPGTCRNTDLHTKGPSPRNAVLRLNIARVQNKLSSFRFHETDQGVVQFSVDNLRHTVGDFIVGRKDSGTSYHLSVVLDDAAQGVTDVVRGADLFDATKIHVALQGLLGLPTPQYHHHRLIRDDAGKRLAKRDDARSIAKYRADGATPNDIRQMIGLSAN